MNAESLLEEVRYYAAQVDAVGGALVELSAAEERHGDFVAQVAESYRILVFDLLDVYNDLKRVLRKGGHVLGGSGPKVPIEILENAFIVLRDAAEAAEAKARKLTHRKSRHAKMARHGADQLALAAENAARILVAEAENLGRWTVEWERDLGLRRWLR